MYVGLDVGGTNLKGARVGEDGEVLARLREPIARERGDDLLAQMERAVKGLSDGARPMAVGIGLPGIVDQETSRLQGVANLPALRALQDADLAGDLARRLGCPVFLENDANAAGLAEAWRGGGRGASSVLYVTLGTGIGGAVILDGRLWTGHSGYAGEIGHMQIDPDGWACGCGSRGCVETRTGIAGWVRQAEELRAVRPSRLQGVVLEPATIVAAAQAGDEVALLVVDGVARALAQAIGGLLNALNAERCVIGGGVAAAGHFLLDRISRETQARCWPRVFEDCSFRLAELGNDAGVVGAARVAMVRLGPRLPA
jgi:glucokinase